MLTFLTKLALLDVVLSQPVNSQLPVQISLLDIVILNQSDCVEPDLIHQPTGRLAGW